LQCLVGGPIISQGRGGVNEFMIYDFRFARYNPPARTIIPDMENFLEPRYQS
jgi:hypothetical protein